MNKDTDLIFEAYKKRLIENIGTSLVPSNEEILSAIEKLNSRNSVEEVKAVISNTVQHYRAVTEDELKEGLYEGYQDAVNYSPMGGGKPRFKYKEYSVAELATLLAKQLKDNASMRERNAKGENAEEPTGNKVEEDSKVFKYQTGTKYVDLFYQPEGYDKKILAYGEIMKIVEPGKVLVRMRSGPDQVNQSGPNSSIVPNKFGSTGKDFIFDYEIKYTPKRGPKVIFPDQDGKRINDIGNSVNVGRLNMYDNSSNSLLKK